jgi:energy-coupling factor transporter ATP-binding protein EcfA2
MFTQLTLKHFKAWRDKIEIPLAPVTVLLGTNSSGKSSLLQALLLMKQTALSPDRSIHLNFGGDDANDYFNFGHFEDVLTRGASPRQFDIGFSFSSNWRNEKGPFKRINGDFFSSYSITSRGQVVLQELKLNGIEYHGREANILELAGVSEDAPISQLELPIEIFIAEVV